MLIKSVIDLPESGLYCHRLCIEKTIDSTNRFISEHIVNPKNAFLSILKIAKSFSGAQKAYVDVEELPAEYQLPAALMIFKAMYKLQVYKTSPKRNAELYFVKQYETVSLLKSLLIGSDLATQPANKMYPDKFCRTVQELFLGYKNVKVSWFDEKEIKEKGLNLVGAVGKGAAKPPRFLMIELGAATGSTGPIALVGKGVVFDSGGYNLKSTQGMLKMKGDKTGAGIVVSIMHYFAKQAIGAPNIIGVIPLVENLISHKAHKIGDIVTAYNGKTVELLNMDAEGRLILADALAYVTNNFNPKLILDFATLTGWAEVLHCDTSFVYFTTNDKIGERVSKIGEMAGERSIRLPNWPEYTEYTKSDIADYKNVNFECGRSDGFMASMFLLNFLGRFSDAWVHFDVTHSTNVNNMHFANAATTAIKLISKL